MVQCRYLIGCPEWYRHGRFSPRVRSSVRSGGRSTSSATAGRWCWCAICSAGRSASRSCACAAASRRACCRPACAPWPSAASSQLARDRTAGRATSSPSAERSLEPIITAIARWYLRHGLDDLQVDAQRLQRHLGALGPRVAALPGARGARRRVPTSPSRSGSPGSAAASGPCGIADGACTVREGFAERADVRYTADARVWCAVALGIADAKDVVPRGLMTKDGGREAMDFYFYQIARQKPTRPQRTRDAHERPACRRVRR